MNKLSITLPWPDKLLSPNARVHWAAKHRKASAYLKTCHALTLGAGGAVFRESIQGAKLVVTLKFYPPDKRKRDLDNLIASMKSGLDGVAQALGVDDNTFELRCERMNVVPDFCGVKVTVERSA